VDVYSGQRKQKHRVEGVEDCAEKGVKIKDKTKLANEFGSGPKEGVYD